jgi:hypothetical protein
MRHKNQNRNKKYYNIENPSWDQDDARIVIPSSKRVETLRKLHSTHQGVERTKHRAHQLVYWPGLPSDITNMARACEICKKTLPSLQREPLIYDPSPSCLFKDIAIYIFVTPATNV